MLDVSQAPGAGYPLRPQTNRHHLAALLFALCSSGPTERMNVMLQGFYSAASGMLMQQRSLNTISNNLANARTPGYKTNRLVSGVFEQTLLSRLERGRFNGIGTGAPVRVVSEVADIFTTGGFAETLRPFDMAVTGSGFFNIQTEDGQTLLTRNGNFDIDDEGYLVMPGRGRVMGVNGPLQIYTSDIEVGENGEISNYVTGENLGQLLITVPNENAVIEETRTGMYQVVEGGVAAAQQPMVAQGVLENSNVDLTGELTAMIAAQRNFASASQALQIIDATYAKAVNIASL